MLFFPNKFKIYLECLKLRSIVFLVGTSLLGALFALPVVNAINILKLGFLLIGSALLYGHAFSLNDLYGLSLDRCDPKKVNTPLVLGKISTRELLKLSLVLLFLSFLFFGFISLKTLIIATLLFSASVFYSHPFFFLKGKPFFSSIIHLIGGILQFLLGYAVFKNIDFPGILIGIYFGIIHTSIHLNSEIIDYNTDLMAQINTNTIKFGKEKVFFISFLLFLGAVVYFCLLAYRGLIPLMLLFIVAVCYSAYLYSVFKILRRGINSKNAEDLVKVYRKICAFIGICMMIFLIFNLKAR